MKLSSTTKMMLDEMQRLKTEKSFNVINTPMLISAINALPRDESNLFNIYFVNELGKSYGWITKNIEKLLDEKLSDLESQTNETFMSPWEELDSQITKSLKDIFEYVEKFAKMNNKEISPNYFIIALFETSNYCFRNFMKEISVNYIEARKFFSPEKVLYHEIVPYNLSSFIRYRQEEFVGKECLWQGRERKLEELYKVLLKTTQRNAIIYGVPGVGKTVAGEQLIYNIANGNVPKPLKEFKVFEMSVKDFINSCKDQSVANSKMDDILLFLSNCDEKTILMIDEIQTVVGSKMFDSKKIDCSTVLKPILTTGKVRIIGFTTTHDYNEYFAKDSALSRRFEGIEIEEPKKEEVLPMIKPSIMKLANERNLFISDDIIEYAIWTAICYDRNNNNPSKTYELINKSMSNAIMEGRDRVTRQDITYSTQFDTKKWDKTSEEIKKSIAYHEAGHAVASWILNSGAKCIGITILPSKEGFGGAAFYEPTDSFINENFNYYMDQIVIDLMGRYAEKLFTNDISAGAGTDLSNATEMAETMVTECGFKSDKVYYTNSSFENPDSAIKINDDIDIIIKECSKEANLLAKECQELIRELAETLLLKPCMSIEEINPILDKYASLAIRTSEKIKKMREKNNIFKNQKFDWDYIKEYLSNVKGIAKIFSKDALVSAKILSKSILKFTANISIDAVKIAFETADEINENCTNFTKCFYNIGKKFHNCKEKVSSKVVDKISKNR